MASTTYTPGLLSLDGEDPQRWASNPVAAFSKRWGWRQRMVEA